MTIPANCTAVVHVPAGDPATISESGVPAAESEGVALLFTADHESRFAVGSGTYQFTFRQTTKG